MLLRSSARQGARRAVQQVSRCQARGLAEPASGSFAYTQGEANGIKIAARDFQGPVTTAAIVTRAGTRFQPLPGLAEGLKWYAFKNNENRSTLRIQRESELLGSALQSYHSRENVVIGAKFLRDDLPYFIELLADVATKTRYEPHVFHEEIYPLMDLSRKRYYKDTVAMALDSVHGVAFHRGLGSSLNTNSVIPMKKYLDAESLSEYAATAYAKPNFAVVANGAEQSELSKWVNEFFTDVPSKPSYDIKAEQTKYYGGEERISHAAGNTLVLAFPGSSSPTGGFYKPEIAVLAALLGGQTTIKWSPGFSLLSKATQDAPNMLIDTKSIIYSDAGLLTIVMSGSASDISNTAPKVVEALQGVAQNITEEDFAKAKALAKFKGLEFGQETAAGIELTGAGLVHGGKAYQIDEVAKAEDGVTIEKVKKAAKDALENKASVSAIGDLFQLPFGAELGLKV